MKESKPRKQCRIAVTSAGNDLNSKVSLIGRSSHFILFEGTPERYTVIENASRGVGTESGAEAAKALAETKVDIVITGTIGSHAYRALQEAGISVKAGCSGTIAEAIKKCAAGELAECKGATYAGNIEL